MFGDLKHAVISHILNTFNTIVCCQIYHKFDANTTDVKVTFLYHFTEILKTLYWAVTSQQRFMAMTSKHRLTSRDDIELGVVVKFCVGLSFQQ